MCRLRQLCNRAAGRSNGNNVVQATATAVDISPQQTLAQVRAAFLQVSAY